MSITVNGETIPENEIRAEMRKLLRVYIDRLPPDQIKEKARSLRRPAEEYAIGRMLLLQEARRREITVPPEEAEEEIENLKKKCGSKIAYEEHLWNLDMTHDQLMAQIVHAKLVDKLILDITDEAPVPSDNDAEQYFQANRNILVKPESVSLSHIMIEVNTQDEEEKEQALNKAKIIHRDLLSGADFADLARKHSNCPSGKNTGGKLGEIAKGQWLPEVEETAFNMDDDAISEPVETAAGYHIIKKHKTNPERGLSFEEAKDVIKDQMLLLRKNRILEEFIAGLKAEAVIDGQSPEQCCSQH